MARGGRLARSGLFLPLRAPRGEGILALVEAELAVARAKASEDEALIAHQKLQIAKLERAALWPALRALARLIDQLALGFEELESARHRGRARGGAGRRAGRRMSPPSPASGRRASPSPTHLPRERVVDPPPAPASAAAAIACASWART